MIVIFSNINIITQSLSSVFVRRLIVYLTLKHLKFTTRLSYTACDRMQKYNIINIIFCATGFLCCVRHLIL
jgi:hypothetical protein